MEWGSYMTLMSAFIFDHNAVSAVPSCDHLLLNVLSIFLIY